MTAGTSQKKFNCSDVEKKVQAFLDGKLDKAQVLLFEEHLDYCLPCDKKIEFEKKLRMIVKSRGKENSYPSKIDLELKRLISKK
jgi:anti-sigma factor (TIGR02949 family)